THGLRVVAEVASCRAGRRGTIRDRGLMDAQHPTDDMVCRVEHVAHIVEEYKSKVIAHERQCHGRRANFQVVYEESLTAYGISGLQVAAAGLGDGETPQRTAAARKEYGRQEKRGRGRRQLAANGWRTE